MRFTNISNKYKYLLAIIVYVDVVNDHYVNRKCIKMVNREDIEIGIYQIPLLKTQGSRLMKNMNTNSVSKALLQLVSDKLGEVADKLNEEMK